MCINYDVPFEPALVYWLGGISIYGREETLGVRLWAFNPNEKKDREEVIKNFILRWFDDLTYRHKFVLFEMLRSALSAPEFDFSRAFESDHDSYHYIAWDETQISDPREFFADIYKLAGEEWKDDLAKAALEDSSSW